MLNKIKFTVIILLSWVFSLPLKCQIALSYRTQCKQYYEERTYNLAGYTNPSSHLELVSFFYIRGIKDKKIQQRINDQLLLIYCFPESEYISSLMNQYQSIGSLNSNHDSVNSWKGLTVESKNLVNDSIYEDHIIYQNSDNILNFCDSTFYASDRSLTGVDNYKAKKIRSLRSCIIDVSWTIVKNEYLLLNIHADGRVLPEEFAFETIDHRLMEIGQQVKNYDTYHNEYSVIFDLTSGYILNFWDLIREKRRYKFMEYFDKMNNAKYSNDSLIRKYNFNVAFPDSFYNVIWELYTHHYKVDPGDSALFKPNYDFRRVGFYDHLGTNPLFYMPTAKEDRTKLYLSGIGRFGQYIVYPYSHYNWGKYALNPVYQTNAIRLSKVKLKKYMKPKYYKIFYN